MATTPKEIKQLLDRLIERQNLPFDEVLSIFADRGGKFRPGAVRERLHFLWNRDLFVLLDEAGELASWDDDGPFKSPAAYTLRFLGIAGREEVYSESFADIVDQDDVQQIVPGYVWVGLKRRCELRIVGEQATATLLAERLRAFTHQFSFHLVTGQHGPLAPLFSSKAVKGQNLETLLTRIRNLETEYGPLDYFDHVQVMQVLNGDTSMMKEGDGNFRMDVPKSISLDAIRGWTQFKLISVRTPHGVAVHDVTVMLKIVEEEGFFRIVDATVVSS